MRNVHVRAWVALVTIGIAAGAACSSGNDVPGQGDAEAGAATDATLDGPGKDAASDASSTKDSAADAATTDAAGDGAPASDAAADADGGPSKKYVFVTSMEYTGNLGGVTGADALCQARAAAGGLPGTYMAFLSDSTTSVNKRFTPFHGPYVLADGVTVVSNDFWTPNPNAFNYATTLHAIDMTELAQTLTGMSTACSATADAYVWTGTATNGDSNCATPSSCCADWTSTAQANGSSWGLATQTTSSWVSLCGGGTCNGTMAYLYCFEQ